jgi:hypothetical protein
VLSKIFSSAVAREQKLVFTIEISMGKRLSCRRKTSFSTFNFLGLVTRVNSTNVLDEGLRIRGRGQTNKANLGCVLRVS